MSDILFKKEEIKSLALHTSTIGAFVQQPNPSIVGVEENEIIASCDAKSLYPTIMALLNIGYDTLFARLYDSEIVEGILNLIKHNFKMRVEEPWTTDQIIERLESSFRTLLDNYCRREDPQGKKALTEFNVKYYMVLITRLLNYHGTLENILTPIGNLEYYLLRGCLLPVLEFVNWSSAKNKKYNKTIIDRVFHNDIYNAEYKSKKFYMFTNVNSTKIQFNIMDFEQSEQILGNMLLNPYGTIYYNQEQYKSFSVDIIINDMKGRAFVKNQMLILEAITTNWKSLTDEEKNSFAIDSTINGGNINQEFANSIINKVGDSDENKRNFQLESLLGIQFGTINNSYNNSADKHKNLLYQLKIMIEQLNVKQNGIKTSLNSDYGIYAMIMWEYANFLISNSITTGGKVLGTNLFQQIAKNVLQIEEEEINNILYQNRDINGMVS